MVAISPALLLPALSCSGTGARVHPDFGGGTSISGNPVLYGIPFQIVDSSAGVPAIRPVTVDPVNGYPSESDGGGYPIPDNAPVEGAYLNCPPQTCPGARRP